MEIKCQLQAAELAWIWQQSEAALSSGKAGIDSTAAPPKDPLNVPAVPCEVGFEFEGVETIWDGYLARLEGTGIDRNTRTFPCRVVVDEPHKTRVNNSAGGRASVTPPLLLSGMYVTVRIPIESPVPLLQLPLEAVRPAGQIWVVRRGQLDVTTVSLAHVDGDLALVRQGDGGLNAGDQVVTSPLASVRDGMPVQQVTEEASR